MMSLLCLLCLAVVGVPGCFARSYETLSVFQTLFNGDFENIAQASNGFLRQQTRLIPVKVPALKGPALFIESVLNGTIDALQLGEVVEIYGNIIRVKLYDFEDFTNLKPLTYDVKKLSQIKPAQLRSDDACIAVVELKGRNSLTFSFPECKFFNKEAFTGIVDCNQYSVTFPAVINGEIVSGTYILPRGPRRYPLPTTSERFVSPCNDSTVY